jgi:hypothetical protein
MNTRRDALQLPNPPFVPVDDFYTQISRPTLNVRPPARLKGK